jgi:flagellar biogenesis protein FliO
MGIQENDVPKASPWPSLRAVGIMLLFMAVVLGLIFLLRRL